MRRSEQWLCTSSGVVLAASMMISATGCYKEVPVEPRAQAPVQPAPAQPAEKPAQPGGTVGQPGSSALGAAKRSAENTVQRAEQASQHAADSVDK